MMVNGPMLYYHPNPVRDAYKNNLETLGPQEPRREHRLFAQGNKTVDSDMSGQALGKISWDSNIPDYFILS